MRFLIQAVNISGTEHEKEMVRALRKICKDSPLNVSVFHPYFVFFDQFELVRPMSLQNMVLGAVVMMIISFVFIPNPLCSLWVAFSIISIETGVIGYMALWKVNLDSISMINLIMCLGFSVDFTAHICYAYMSSSSKKSDDRVRDCLYAVGLPIFQGAVSTILGMVALLLADSYIFSVFFKMVFLVVFCGAMHGLFLLPVLLSLFGPGSCQRHDKVTEINITNIDKTLPHPYSIPHPHFTLNPKHIGNNVKTHDVNGFEKQKQFKHFGDIEKDLGIGTSEENSSESSSNKSNNFSLNKSNNFPMDKDNFSFDKINFSLDRPNFSFEKSNFPLDKPNFSPDKSDLPLEKSFFSMNKSNYTSNNLKKNPLEEDQKYQETWRRNSAIEYPSSQFHSSQILDIYGNNTENEWFKRKERYEENKKKFFDGRLHDDRKEREMREINRNRRRYSPPEQNFHRSRQNLNRSHSYHNLHHPKYVQELRFP